MTEFQPLRKDFAQTVRAMFDTIPIHQTMGIELDDLEPGFATGHMPLAEAFTQQNGYLQAGAILALADAVGGAAGYTLMAEGENILSVNFSISMLRPVAAEEICAEGRVIKAGKRLYFVEVILSPAGEKKVKTKPLTVVNITLTAA